MRYTNLTITLIAILSATPGFALGQNMEIPQAHAATHTHTSDGSESNSPEYDAGLKAMDEGRWADALKAFDKVASVDGPNRDSALYWKAYSLEKLDRKAEATAACGQLEKHYPHSAWNQECQTLSVESTMDLVMLKKQIDSVDKTKFFIRVQPDSDALRVQSDAYRGQAEAYRDIGRDINLEAGDFGPDDSFSGGGPGVRTPHDPNDDLKLLALNSLMEQEPEKAMPVLRAFIFSDKPIELRRRAMFVLGQSQTPAAQALLVEIATKNPDVKLQRAAVQTLATTRGKDAVPQLKQIYASSTDNGVKRAAVSGLFIAGDAPGLVELARAEKDVDLKREIVTQLSMMHDPAATAYMEELLK